MTSLLYFIAFIMMIEWLIGVFAYSGSGLIHILLVLAVIAVLFRLISVKGIWLNFLKIKLKLVNCTI